MRPPTIHSPQADTGEQVEQRKGASSRFTIWATTEQVVLVASMFWVLAANRCFLQAALHDRPLNDWLARP